MSDTIPNITIEGGKVDARHHVEKGTAITLLIAFLIAIVATLSMILVTYGVMLIVILAYPLFSWYFHKKAAALIHGSGVHVNDAQFSEIHCCVANFRERLDLKADIDVYIIQQNVMNAAAVKYGRKNVILLTDDLIHSCIASGHPEALAFIIAHELAHISLNHNGVIRSWMSQHLKRLGRKDEYSADSTAMALVGDKDMAYNAILLSTVGHSLLACVKRESIMQQVQDVAQNKYSKKAEKSQSHPLLLNRLARTLTAES